MIFVKSLNVFTNREVQTTNEQSYRTFTTPTQEKRVEPRNKNQQQQQSKQNFFDEETIKLGWSQSSRLNQPTTWVCSTAQKSVGADFDKGVGLFRDAAITVRAVPASWSSRAVHLVLSEQTGTTTWNENNCAHLNPMRLRRIPKRASI